MRNVPAYSDMERDDAIMAGFAQAEKDLAELATVFNAIDHASMQAAWRMIPGEMKEKMKMAAPEEYRKFVAIIGGE